MSCRKSWIKSSYIHVKRSICVPISFTRFTREKIVPQINVSHQNVGNNYFLHKCKEKQNKIKFFYKNYLVPTYFKQWISYSYFLKKYFNYLIDTYNSKVFFLKCTLVHTYTIFIKIVYIERYLMNLVFVSLVHIAQWAKIWQNSAI